MKKVIPITLILGLLFPGTTGAMNPEKKDAETQKTETIKIKIKTQELINWAKKQQQELERREQLEANIKNKKNNKFLQNFTPRKWRKEKPTIKINSQPLNYETICRTLKTKINEITTLTKDTYYQLKINQKTKTKVDSFLESKNKQQNQRVSDEHTLCKQILNLAQQEFKEFLIHVNNAPDIITRDNFTTRRKQTKKKNMKPFTQQAVKQTKKKTNKATLLIRLKQSKIKPFMIAPIVLSAAGMAWYFWKKKSIKIATKLIVNAPRKLEKPAASIIPIMIKKTSTSGEQKAELLSLRKWILKQVINWTQNYFYW